MIFKLLHQKIDNVVFVRFVGGKDDGALQCYGVLEMPEEAFMAFKSGAINALCSRWSLEDGNELVFHAETRSAA